MLEGWHEFYALLGTAAAALVALLFVAISIGATVLTPETNTATRTFLSPVVFHYSAILLVSLIALMPTHSRASLVLCIGAVAVVGLAYSVFVIVRLWRSAIRDNADRLGYGGLPLVAYAGVLVATAMILKSSPTGPDVLAVALILLLLVNIRNAWDLMIAFARRVGSRESNP